MFGRSGKAAWVLVCALGGCSTDAAPEPEPAPEPPPPLYDLERPTGGLKAPRARGDEFRRGVSLGLFVSSDDDEVRMPIYETFLDEIAATGATDLQLSVRWGQRDVSSSEITPHPTKTVDDKLLARVMQGAKRRSLRVFLMPILHVEERDEGRWRGALKPEDPERWWWSYRRFVMHYARLAQSNDAVMFSVGSELLSLEGEDARWRELVGDVRKVFEGELTYSANWDHFEEVSFWDALDVVGVTAYQDLSDDSGASDAALRKGFAPFAQGLRRWAMAEGYRYLFTEVGYMSQPGAAQKPWDYRKKGPVDLKTQLRCYRALYEVWQDDPRLAGLYVWNWFGEGGAKDSGYSPRDKPAQAVLAHWFQGSVPDAKTATAGKARP